MANLGQLVVNLEANIAQFTSDMGRASQQTEQAMSKISGAVNLAKGAFVALGAVQLAGNLLGEVNKAIDALAGLDDMAQKTGASVETLSKLSKVAAFTNTDFGAVDSVVTKLAKNLSDVDEKGSKTAKALAAIGISTKDIKDQDPAQVFVKIAGKLQDYGDGAGKVALVTDLMGKSAADLLPYMNDVAESIDKFSGDSAQAAADAAKFQDQLGLLRVKYNELTTAIVIAALPAANAFVGALLDTTRESNNLTKNTHVDTWADNVALGLARITDRAKLTVGLFSALAGSVKVVGADILTLATLSPANMAVQVAQGKNPLTDFRAMMAEREKILTDANAKWDRLLNAPVNAIEAETRKRIDEQRNAAGLAALGASAGINSISLGAGRPQVNYSSGGGTNTPRKDDKAWSAQGAMDRMMTGALNETLAIKNTTAATEELIAADVRRAAEKERTTRQVMAAAENIRMSLMSEIDAEQFEHETRISELQAYGELALSTTQETNALIEAETARHEKAKADIERAAQLEKLALMGNSADQLYGLMKQAGMEQTALGKAVFLASKAMAVAEIIMNTEVAAAKAQAQFGVYGTPIAIAIRVAGYASAGLVAGMAIADASAEGGYDIPGGVNPVTQLHEKEMVLPKAQAEVIRGLAANGGAGGGMKVTIVNQTTGRIDNVIEKRISPTERALIIQEAVAATASTLGDPNSKMSRSMSRNLNVARSR
jgi:hypothetical protein